ncbi:hypothetical protein AC249_AIPGENE23030 [Exaiptasia diaphana]|nr:hypothetical protein AC249_AIPGENE23030 [Exaiptasia diaphana]
MQTVSNSRGQDDNGAYISKGSAKRLFQYSTADGARTVHEENGTFFANVKTSKGYKRDYVPDNEVFELTRYYRASKSNPTFTRNISTVKGAREKDIRPFFLVMYKCSGEVKEFVTQRDGNAKKSTSSNYFHKDPEVFKTIDTMLEKGLSTDKIYNEMIQSSINTVSQTISHPKMIANRRQNNKGHKDTTSANQYSEAETLIASLHKIPIIHSVTFTKEQYAAVDTTFELVDGLWLTDTSFQHEGLICERDSRRHPEFPGPSFWHFCKNRETYRRFAGELLIEKPELSGIKKVGNGLDKAIAKGMKDIFKDAKNVKVVRYTGNVYLHFLTTCLKDYDQKFEFSAITVPKRTLQFLPDGGVSMLKAKGLHVES